MRALTRGGRVAAALITALLAGCSKPEPVAETAGSTDADADVDADTDLDALTVSTVDPPWGSTAGGQLVTITGGPFDSSAEVFFGGVRGTLATVSSSEISATSPPNASEGYVNVEVVTDTHYGKKNSAFNYWADGTGMQGVLGIISWLDYQGNYWGTPAPVDEGSASLYFITPQSLPTWWNLSYAPSLNTCQSSYTYSGSTSVYPIDPSASAARLSTPSGGTISLAADPVDTYYFAASIGVPTSGWYGVDPITGSSDFPEFELGNAVYMPPAFQVTTPNLNQASLPNVSRSNFRLVWNGSGGDYVTLELGRQNNAGTIVEWVTCAVSDTGSFTVPSGTWAGWGSGSDVIHILVSRWVEGGDPVPFNNAANGMAGVYTVYGGGGAVN